MAVIGNAGVLNRNSKSVSSNKNMVNKAKRNTAVKVSRTHRVNGSVMAVAFVVFMAFLIVLLTAQAATLQTENNKIEQQNEYLAAEIDSINNDITDETTLDKIEKSASKKYGMIYPNSSNYITIKDDEPIGGNLADAIKEEVYG